VKKDDEKVSWPWRDEVVGTTTVVVLYTFVMGIYLFGVDAIVTPAVDKLFKAFGA
jgi:preprotein translocase SecE subunit